MTLDAAMGASTLMMGLAFIQQSLEHMRPAARPAERLLFAPRLLLSMLLVASQLGAPLPVLWLLAGLLINHLAILHFFAGPYNGGCDRMSLLILLCLTAAYAMPQYRELAFGYLGAQLTLSYFISGWVKVVNPAWRNGRALNDVFRFSAYPAGENIRGWAQHPRLLLAMGWAVMLFELAFPLSLATRPTLILALIIAATFHGANACLFGLNRFFWIWLCAYPSILWLQERVVFPLLP